MAGFASAWRARKTASAAPPTHTLAHLSSKPPKRTLSEHAREGGDGVVLPCFILQRRGQQGGSSTQAAAAAPAPRAHARARAPFEPKILLTVFPTFLHGFLKQIMSSRQKREKAKEREDEREGHTKVFFAGVCAPALSSRGGFLPPRYTSLFDVSKTPYPFKGPDLKNPSLWLLGLTYRRRSIRTRGWARRDNTQRACARMCANTAPPPGQQPHTAPALVCFKPPSFFRGGVFFAPLFQTRGSLAQPPVCFSPRTPPSTPSPSFFCGCFFWFLLCWRRGVRERTFLC